LCSSCMAVWTVTIAIFWYVTLHNLNRYLPAPPTLSLITRYHGVVLTAWTVLLLALIGEQFWSYWRTLP